MSSKIAAVALFAFTVGTVALYPLYPSAGAEKPPRDPLVQGPPIDPQTQERPRIEVVFVLDTTGSMSGLIHAAQEKIWSIATTMAQAQPAPQIRMGLVAYRDRGDEYVTRVVDLSDDLDSVYATLMDLRADGGGDTPESVNAALDDAVNRVAWSADQGAYKVIFLVGDAPPHSDYQGDVQYPRTLAAARAKGIVVNTIQAGNSGATRHVWTQIARHGEGQYAQVEQSGNAVAIATPFDERLALLSQRLDETRLYYGSDEQKAKRQRKQAAARKLHDSASLETRARRATFNATASGATNLLGEGELVDDVASGRVDLDSLAPAALPAPLQALAPAEQKAAIEAAAGQRAELKREIETLAAERAGYLEEQVAAAGGARDSLDDKLYGAIRAQAGKKGLHYEADAPAY
ncbi:MAG: VWA domain-containing protein [Gammaproteobacteria bacterium]|nr:VWA domain-containing protein [Gammaproteobacteria bacterium]